ncbi:hypothetical protein ACQKGA_23680 [Priestia megaterium]|uniref:hypothetical protein n=1 Tax=Priestia megaterium TaxID=1404 RepID=UPI002731B9DA|nr:hypothetical protein [Priestia megaterium]MDP1383343.1 hypothetical protein [Priestia megaterium]MDP1427491.1 hypothetical protein [Priestia megaterium]
MGGREGGRGYLYQSIATLLGSLFDKEWKYVEVEVESELDKIDIQWEYEENKKKVVQVKSSQNNISKSSILHWLEELIEDAPTADEYELFLIGNTSDTTSSFISKLNRSKELPEEYDKDGKREPDYDDLKKFEGSLSKIKVKVENFTLDSLETKINWNLSKLLSEMGHVVSPTVIDLIAGGMINQFTKFSTEGTKISRDQYIGKFEEWIQFNYPQVRGAGLVKKVLSVEFYLKDQVEFSTSMKALNGNSTRIINAYKSSLMALVEPIQEINLPAYRSKNTEVAPLGNTTLFNFSGLGITIKREEYSDELKEKLIAKTKALLDVDIEKSFFYVGQLESESNPLKLATRINPNSTTLLGNEIEKEKAELIDAFFVKLYEYEGIVEYLNYLDSFKVVPLVLRNTGAASDEEIEVNIKIPTNVKVATAETLDIPNDFAISQFTEDDGLLNLLKHERSYNIEKYYTSTYNATNYMTKFARLSQAEQDKINKEEFADQLESLFDFKVYEDTEYTVLQFHFIKLNSSKNMAFPSFLLVNAEESFSMDYEITSKNLGTKITGSLYYEI